MSIENTPTGQNQTEARIFVRHTNGNLVIPEPSDEIEHLSFSVPIYGSRTPLDVIREVQDDEDAGMGFFHIQHYLGIESASSTTDRQVDTYAAHGYLAQSHSPNAPFRQVGRMELPLDEARDVMKHSPAIHPLDRRLAFSVFNIIQFGTARPKTAHEQAVASSTPETRDGRARDAIRRAERFSHAMKLAYGDAPMTEEDIQRLMAAQQELYSATARLMGALHPSATEAA